MTAKRTIKKYPNRRLYDMALSSYVTLEDLRKIIVEGNEIQVIDAKTSEDMTHLILMQILTTAESDGEVLFSNEALQQFIRLYFLTTPATFRKFLESSLKFFVTLSPQQSQSFDWFPQWSSVSSEWIQYFKKNE